MGNRNQKIKNQKSTENWRTGEIEEYSNLYVIHPISAELTRRLARWNWSPNTVSGLGLLSALLASYSFYHYRSLGMSMLGLAFMLGWHIFDGADGQLARLTGKTSEFGKVIDGLCDHLGFGMVYIALAMATQPLYGPGIWIVATTAALSHLVQAGALEFHRDNYDCWVHRKAGKCVPSPDRLRKMSSVPHDLLQSGHILYVRMQLLIAEADADLLARGEKLRDQPDRETLGQIYQRIALNSVRRWGWLSANKRTFAVAIFCMVNLPILFFLFEIVVLNGLLLWLQIKQRQTNRVLLRAILRTRGLPSGEKPWGVM